jgi:hypothetical protein
MGIGSSAGHEKLGDLSNNGSDFCSVLESVRTRYGRFIANLPPLDFYSEDMKLNYTRNQDLTESELYQVCDEYGISKSKRRRDKGYSLNVIYQMKGRVKKCIIFFYRQNENLKYNILLAEAEQFSELNWCRVTTIGGTALGVSILLMATVNVAAGGATLATSGLAVAGKLMYDSKYHGAQDLVLGYMITELEVLGVIAFRDSQCFLRENGQLIAISMTDLSC